MQKATCVQVLWLLVSDDFFYSNKNMQKGEKAEIKGSLQILLVMHLFLCYSLGKFCKTSFTSIENRFVVLKCEGVTQRKLVDNGHDTIV